MLTSKHVSAGIAGTDENSNYRSCYSSIVCGDIGMFWGKPADGDVETQRGKIETDPRNGQKHDGYLLRARRQNQSDCRGHGQGWKTDARSVAWEVGREAL